MGPSYLGEVKNPMVKAHLEATEKHVADHLEKAKAIQQKLS